MSQQDAQEGAVAGKLTRPSAKVSLSRLKSRASVNAYRPRTLQRVSVARWEGDADLEQGEEGVSTSSVSDMRKQLCVLTVSAYL